MTNPFTRPLLAGFVALALGLSPVTAAPAAADQVQTRNLILGLAAAAIIAGAINDANRRSGTVSRNTAPQAYVPPRGWTPQPATPRGDARVLPASCLVDLQTRHRDIRLFSESCLDRSYRFARRLPDSCEVRVFTRRGPVLGYDPRCLRDAGYTTDRRVDWGNRGWGQRDWDREDWQRGPGHRDH